MNQIDNDFLNSLKKLDVKHSLLLFKYCSVHEKISLLIKLRDTFVIPDGIAVRSKMPGNLVSCRTTIENLLSLEKDDNVIAYSIAIQSRVIENVNISLK